MWHCNIELQEKQENVAFLSSYFNLDLYKSQTNEAIEKIKKKDIGSLIFPLQFLFSWPYFKINSLPIRAADLKAVKGGESALAMAKMRYNTVLVLVLWAWQCLILLIEASIDH